MRYLRYALILCTCVLLTAFIRTEDPIDKIIAATQRLVADYPQEKVFLHTDKPYYVAGDTIWYKAYAVDARLNQPSAMSQVLYVDLVNDKDSVVVSQRIKLMIGLGNAQIALPVNTKPGNYTLFAYTGWMKNFGAHFFFQQQVKIGSTFAEDVVKKDNTAAKTDLQFFPEGGALVTGIRSVVAFKALGSNGAGQNVSGYIVDELNQKVIEFVSEHAGMGVFPFNPEAGKKYTAVLNAGGKEERYSFPSAVNSGYVLAVNNRDSINLSAKVTLTADLVADKELILIVQQNNEVKYVSKFKPKQINTIQLPKAKLNTGLAQITLFNGELPLAERLVFINRNDALSTVIGTDKREYSKLEQVNLNLEVMNNKVPVMGSFSVAVVNAEMVKYDEHTVDNIISNLLLTSDLKGKIESPGYYFSNNSEEVKKHLDYLMLTQGWRRFNWKAILSGTYPPLSASMEKGLSISGKILTFGDKPLPRAKATLVSSRGSLFTSDTLTNEKGEFNFDEMSFPDSTIFVVQVQKENGNKNIKTVINGAVPYKLNTVPFMESGMNMQAYLEGSKGNYQSQYQVFRNNALMIQEVEIKGEKKKIVKESKNLNGSGNADMVITSEMLKSAISLTDYISKYVNGVEQFRSSDDPGVKLFFKRTGDDIFGNPKAPIQFIIDGIEVSQDFIDNFAVEDIEGVEVLKSAAFNALYGSNGLGGTIIVTTKRGRSSQVPSPGISMVKPQGYQIERQFYVPKYTAKSSGINDKRSTVYWNANVITGKDGKAGLSFSNNSLPGTYKIIVQGIDAEGNLAYAVQNYSVK